MVREPAVSFHSVGDRRKVATYLPLKSPTDAVILMQSSPTVIYTAQKTGRCASSRQCRERLDCEMVDARRVVVPALVVVDIEVGGLDDRRDGTYTVIAGDFVIDREITD